MNSIQLILFTVLWSITSCLIACAVKVKEETKNEKN